MVVVMTIPLLEEASILAILFSEQRARSTVVRCYVFLCVEENNERKKSDVE